MSAITGIFYRNGRTVPEEQIKKMNDRLSHRGPDGSSIWCEGPVGLGHQMFWTTPESLHETLPFEEDGLVITADARIDNRRELSKKLGIEDKEEVTDSYFILKAYQRWGEKCPEELLGDFAFAVWDKDKGKLFCARDHMGVKPFYYYLSDEMFVFGTEIKTLFVNSEVPRNLNKVMIGDYFLYQFNDKKITFYEKIFRIPNAHYLNINFNEEELKQYWKLDINKKIEFESEENYIKKFKEIFSEAVRCRLRSKFSTGAFLSGGLDSSSIVCTARTLEEKNKLKTFSAVFDKVIECDERFYINKVLSKTDFDSYFIHADKISPLYKYKEFFWHFDQPFYGPNLFWHWRLTEEAHKNNTKVILDGFDGDITLSANNRYLADLAVKLEFKRLIKELKILSNIHNKNFFDLLITKVIGPLIPESIKEVLLTNKLLIPLKWRRDKFVFINDEFIEFYGLIERYDQLLGNDLKNANTSKKYHYHRLNSGSLQFLLELTNSVGGAMNVEFRYPFFDRRLIEYSLALPPEQKYYNGYDRIMMRRAMQGILPHEVQWRRQKSNLSPNFNRGFLLFERNRIENLVNKDWSIIKDYVDINYLKKEVEAIDDDKPNHTSLIKIWVSLTLAMWLQK